MNNTISKIGMFEAIGFVVIVMFNNIILNVPKEIINSVSSAAWINVIVLTLICVVLAILIIKFTKNFPYMDIIDISEFLGGKFLKILIGIAFIFIFLLLIGSSLRVFSGILQINILTQSPMPFIAMFFIIGIIFANRYGIKTISKVASISFIIVTLGFIILVLALNEHYTIYSLFPALGYGIKETFIGGLTNIYAFTGITILYFIKPFLSSEGNFPKIAVISIIVSGILLLLSILNQLLMFGVIYNSEILMGMIMSSRILNFGHFFQRVDAVFTFLWIFSQLCYLSIVTFFSLHIFKKITNTSDQNGMLYSFALIIFGICVYPQNFTTLSNNIIPFINNFKTILIIIISPIIIILAHFKFKYKFLTKKGGPHG